MPKQKPSAEPEIVTRLLMPSKTRDGKSINIGAGVTHMGGIALINDAPDGIAVVTAEGASNYLGILRKMLLEAVGSGQNRSS